MADSPKTEIFRPETTPSADWAAAGNWSGGTVPSAGVTAEIVGLFASIDPTMTIETAIHLEGGADAAGLVGNGGAVALGRNSWLDVAAAADLFAYDSAVGMGTISLACDATLNVVVDLGALTGLPGAAPPLFVNDGTIEIGANALVEIGGTAFDDAGTVDVVGGTLAVDGGALQGAGQIALSEGASVRLADGVADQTFLFGPGGGTLTIDDPFLGRGVTIADLAAGDTIVLPTLRDGHVRETGDTVSLVDSAGHVDGQFVLRDSAGFHVETGSGGTTISGGAYDPPCFARGTLILTRQGPRPVETLTAGDEVVTADGKRVPVVWTGSRTLDLAMHPAPEKVKPVCFAPGSIADGVPARRLRLSPDHAVWFDNVLIPAKFLVNGATITQEDACLAITYYHVELARHDVILAEGAPCESYLDTGNRAGFSAAQAWPVRNLRWDRDACAPLCTGGPALLAVRQQLHHRALAEGFRIDTVRDTALWTGGMILPVETAGWLSLPAGHDGRAILRSSCFVPACVDPASDDRRMLGVALAALQTDLGDIHLDDCAVEGFHSRASGDAARWTNGRGEIILPREAQRVRLHLEAFPRIWQRAGA
jgi:hypothetical protein